MRFSVLRVVDLAGMKTGLPRPIGSECMVFVWMDSFLIDAVRQVQNAGLAQRRKAELTRCMWEYFILIPFLLGVFGS